MSNQIGISVINVKFTKIKYKKSASLGLKKIKIDPPRVPMHVDGTSICGTHSRCHYTEVFL